MLYDDEMPPKRRLLPGLLIGAAVLLASLAGVGVVALVGGNARRLPTGGLADEPTRPARDQDELRRTLALTDWGGVQALLGKPLHVVNAPMSLHYELPTRDPRTG